MLQRFLCLLFILLVAKGLPAQENVLLIKGKVASIESKSPLSYVSIGILHTFISTYSNELGEFELNVPSRYINDSTYVLFSALGYDVAKFYLKDKEKNQMISVFLRSHENELNEVLVIGLTARSVMAKAIDQLSTNVYQKPFIQECFFRQYHQENGKYVRLIETFVDVYHPTFLQTNSNILKERFRVRALRRSNVYEQNSDVHGDHLSDLLLENIVLYSLGGPLNKKNLNYFTCHFMPEGDSQYYVIAFESKPGTNQKRLKGSIQIDKEHFAIVKIECDRYPVAKSKDVNWRFINGHLLIEFGKLSGKYVVQKLKMFYNHDVINKRTGMYQWTVEENFELYTLVNHFENVDSLHEAIPFSDMSNLYDSKYASNAFDKLQKQFNVNIPFPEGLRKDMELNSISLEEQFKKQGE
jgi:hypothetical protein